MLIRQWTFCLLVVALGFGINRIAVSQEATGAELANEFVVTLLSDNDTTAQIQGQIISISAQQLVLKTNSGDRVFDLHAIERITPATGLQAIEAPAAEQFARLVDGSLMGLVGFQIDDRKLTGLAVDPDRKLAISIETRNVDWVRCDLNPVFDHAWKVGTAKPPAGDALLILKNGELESLEGIIQSVDSEKIAFKFDDELVEVKRQRVFGIAFYHAAGRKFSAPTCRCRDRAGNQWIVARMTVKAGQLEMELTCGERLQLAIGDIAEFDFTFGKMVYVSDLEAAAEQWSPQIDSGPLADQLVQLMTWERDRSLDRTPLKLFSSVGFRDKSGTLTQNEKEFAKGISLRSGTKIAFDLPEDFIKLTGRCGIDPAKRPLGHVVLRISGDGRELYSQPVGGRDMQPQVIDVDVKGVSRLVITVDYGEFSDIADHLNICDLRLSR
jgi:hypothetical protein